MRTYPVLQQRDRPAWDRLPVARIDRFCWNDSYQPLSKAQLCLTGGRTLAVRMYSYETDPRSVCREIDGPVYRDSCLEFFFNPFPCQTGCYLNFECSHRGILFINYGSETDWHFRRKTASLGLPHPPVETFSGRDGDGDYWGVSYEIPLTFFQPIYGRTALPAGHVMRGGFFKCGDDTPRPHFGSWQDIDFPRPNFHLPQFFGELVIGPIP